MQRVIREIERSGRKVMLVVVPEHGAAVRGDRVQTARLRDIPSMRITQVPTMVKFIGIKNMPEETIVVLEGTIAPGEDEEMYVFTDNTGSIDVVIDEEDMEGLNIGANDIVIIEGEIDQNGDNIEVDVEEITLAQ